MLRRLSKEFKELGKYIVQQSKSRLSKKENNSSGTLYDSIKYEFSEPSTNVYNLALIMEKYGEFLDQGVHGTKSSYVTARNSPFRYKESSSLMGVEYYSGKNKKFGGIFGQWAKSKNIRLRVKKGEKGGGQYKAGNYKSIGFVLARSIKEKGIDPTFFFTKSLDLGVEKYTPLLQTALARDVEELIRINLDIK